MGIIIDKAIDIDVADEVIENGFPPPGLWKVRRKLPHRQQTFRQRRPLRKCGGALVIRKDDRTGDHQTAL